ncbi:hypothetical protein [Paenibacillus sp. MABNR03]|uniref:hypothetical protein n=1 Tax=Paenibacillus sp. MABNR03 TaxID=3142626 RepID=UPI003D2AA031
MATPAQHLRQVFLRVQLSSDEVTRQACQPVAGHFFFRSMYVRSAIINIANTITSLKEKFIGSPPTGGKPIPHHKLAVHMDYTI